MAESLPRRKSSLLKVQLGGLFLRDLATEGTIFPVLVFPNPVGEKNRISYYVGCLSLYENSHTPKLKTFLISERENKSLEEKFLPVEFTFSLSSQISYIDHIIFYSVCLWLQPFSYMCWEEGNLLNNILIFGTISIAA